MTFVVQELRAFSIKKFNLRNVLNASNTGPSPAKNSSLTFYWAMAHTS